MAAIDFPTAPILNQVFAANNGVSYIWNGSIWITVSSGAAQASDTPPSNPVVNQLWFNSALGQLFIYYNDGSSSQWVPANPSAGPVVPAGTMYFYSEHILASPGLILAVTIPTRPRLVRLQWGAYTAGAVNDTFYLQAMQGGTPYTAANYEAHSVSGIGSTAFATAYTGQIGYIVSGGISSSGWWETSWLASAMNYHYGTSQVFEVQTGGVRAIRNHGTYFNTASPTNAQITGFRLTPGTNNFTADSYLRCFVVT